MALIAPTMFLTGCATPKTTDPVTVKEYVCPKLEPWSAADQRAAAEDLAYLPKSSPVFDLLASAYRLRDEVKACAAHTKQTAATS